MTRFAWPLALLLISPLAADDCEGEPTPHPGAGPDVTVVAFDTVHQQFGDGDTRTVTTTATFPEAGLLYERIWLHYRLECPEGGCDPWDRTAYVEVVNDEGVAVEVGRFITPYGVGYEWAVDVTDYRPLLAGEREVRAFVDTWVNPGWEVTVSFEMIGGEPERRAIDVIPLVRGYYTYGNPADPIDDHLPPVDVALPAGAGGAAVRVLATGHGFGYTENCAEFCPKTHTLTFNGASSAEVLWRDDCVRTAAPDQSGTWWYSRAGWCPGADVTPRIWDVSEGLTPGAEATFQYAVEPYENLVDDGDPYVILSADLIVYE